MLLTLSFINRLQLTNWGHTMNDDSLTTAYSNFVKKFAELYNLSFPVRRKRVSRAKGIPYKVISCGPVRTFLSLSVKDKLYRKYRLCPTPWDKRVLSECKKYRLVFVIRASKKRYYCNLVGIHKRNLKKAWGILNDLLDNDWKESFTRFVYHERFWNFRFTKYCWCLKTSLLTLVLI